MWFDKARSLLIFRADNQLYSLDRNKKVNFVLGSRDTNEFPQDQLNVKQSQVIIPYGDRSFAISNDGRILFAGAKPADSINGSGLGLQYILSGFDPASKDSLVNLRLLPYEGKNRPNYGEIYNVDYDAKSNSFFANHAWWSFARMSLPTPTAEIASYEWNYLTHVRTGSNRSLLEQIIADEKSDGKLIPAPRESAHYSYALVYAGANTLYLLESKNGIVFSYDLATNRMSRLVGFDIGGEETQLGINRRLDDPRSPILDNQGNLLFNDLFNLQRINLSSAGPRTPNVETLIRDFGFEPFVFDGTKSEVWQMSAHSNLAVYNYNNLSQPAKLFTSPLSYSGYYLQFGFSNSLANLKTLTHTSTWDGYQVKHSLMRVNEFGARSTWPAAGGAVAGTQTLMSHADLLGTGYPGCPSSCPNPISSNDSYDADKFRLVRTSSLQYIHGGVSRVAFTTNDQSYVACVVDPKNGKSRFAEFDIPSKKVYVFAAYTSGGSEIGCYLTLGQISQAKGTMYYAYGNQVYALDMSKVRTSATATVTPVNIEGKFYATRFGGLLINDSYVYYTDLDGDRVLRNKRK